MVFENYSHELGFENIEAFEWCKRKGLLGLYEEPEGFGPAAIKESIRRLNDISSYPDFVAQNEFESKIEDEELTPEQEKRLIRMKLKVDTGVDLSFDFDEEDRKIWVAHYTSKEKAEIIKKQRKLVTGNGEGYVYVMIEPSTAAQAAASGAKSTEYKVMFKVDILKGELEHDIGLSDAEQPRAWMFRVNGQLDLDSREWYITPTEQKKENLFDKLGKIFNRK